MRIIIRAVPSRIEYINYLQEKLPKAEWIIDKKGNGAMWSYLKALELLNNKSGIIMEDDALLCTNFLQKISKEISKKPFNFINFFSMRKADLEIGSRWYSDYTCNICTFFPEGQAEKILEWHKSYWEPANFEGNKPTSACDLFLRSYFKKNKIKCWLVVPNLVDHRIGVSAIDSRRSSKRISKTFKG
tara:strand:- start:3228 stop:3788 length:561 start_codon:yes stop_codon:yes gene_type:complete